MTTCCKTACLALLTTSFVPAQHDHEHHAATDPTQAVAGWRIEDIAMPDGVAPEIGGIALNSRGELLIATRRSGIWIATPTPNVGDFAWRPFTRHSLHNPMGILVLSDGDLLVPQMPELTRIRDTDGDGTADSFEAVTTGWGVSGNYHETNAGPIPDGEGNWFVAVGTASHNGPTFAHVRGEFSPIGRRGRNFSAVEWKGWVVKVTPDGEVLPYANGFRANNGITLGPDGKLWVTDNQGDWRGTSPIYHVVEGGFYGHPSSLVWRDDHPGDDPLNYPLEKLEAMRTRAAVELPQGDVCNSPSEPLFDDTGGAFGPFTGQMFVGDIAGPRILRVMLEEVAGVMQGAVIPFQEGGSMRGGTNRLCFSPDGRTLYAGQTYRGWGKPSEGLQRITFTGMVPQEIVSVSLTGTGFRLTTTQPLDAAKAGSPANYSISHFHYDYGRRYGSPKREVTEVRVQSAVLSPNGKTVELTLDTPLTRHVLYRIDCTNVGGIEHPVAHYTVNALR